MPAMANLLVKDDSATPIEFTLEPLTDSPDSIWRANLAGVPIDGQVQCTLQQTALKNGGYKMSLKLEVPVQETLGASGTSAGYVAPPKVAYTTVCIFSMFSDRRSTTQDRANALKMALGVLQGASATTATGTLANTAAGSAFVNSTLPIPYALTRSIRPN